MPAKRTKSPARPGGVTNKPLTPPSPKKKSPRRSKRSPARTQSSPAERRSPARTKSPARRPRSPTRKSPARIEKSPARIEKSPARTEKSPARHTEKSPARRTEKSPKSAKRSPKKKSPARKPETPSKLSTEFISRREEIFLNEPKVLLVNHDKGDGYKLGEVYRASREMSTSSFTIRRSTRIIPRRESAEPEQRKYEDRKVIEQVSVSDDEEEWEKPIKEASKPSKEFGGILGTLLLPILFQVTFLASHVYTSKAQYGIKDFKIPTNWRTYFDIEVAAIFLGFIVLQLILTILPIGKLVDGMPGKSGRLRYRCNGFFSTVVTLAILGGLRHFQFPVLVVLDKYFQYFVTSLIYGYIFGVILYIKGLRAPVISQNPHAVTGNHIYDFYMGREINPRIGPFDIKIGLLRVGLIGLVVVNAAFILKNVQQSGGYSPTLLVCAGLQIWYALDALWFEESFLSSFEIMYEGMGYMLTMGYCAYPFIPTLITRMIHNYRLEIPVYALVIISVIHAIGYVIFRRSNSQKSEFRKNPLNPALAHLETIPTTRGKKLLVSGWWGFVRHPNYLGDIIMHWAWASTTGFAHPLPYVVVPLFITVLLATRTLRDDARCRQRYQGAWDRYCNRVKYRLVPKVF